MTQTLPQLLAAPLDPCHCEASAYPWWFILDPKAITARAMSAEDAINAVGMSVVTGPFFSRESASTFLKDTRYNFGKDAVVWCSSGCFSEDYVALLEMAKRESVVERTKSGAVELDATTIANLKIAWAKSLRAPFPSISAEKILEMFKAGMPRPLSQAELDDLITANQMANRKSIGVKITFPPVVPPPVVPPPVPSPIMVSAECIFSAAFGVIQAKVHDNARTKGWWEEDRNEAELIALEHAELSEALEAMRHGNGPSEHIPEFSGVEEELADVIIRIMDHAAAKGHRVAEAIIAKMAFNSTRPYKHGKRF